MKDFRTLQVWQKSHILTVELYKETKTFPKDEIYGITSQLRRAIYSIPTNLAEGCGRGSDKDFSRFVQIALGSASEAEYLILLCGDLNYLSIDSANKFIESVNEIKKMLIALIKSLNT
jgi:four helix bundle protein